MSQPPTVVVRPTLSGLTGADDLTAIEALSGTGIAARTGTNTWALRTLQQPAAGITITNPAGTAGDPTLVLANDLAALEGLASTGMIARTGDGTAAVRTITQPAAGITVADGSGVSGNPTLALADDLAAVEGLSGTGLAVRTGTSTWANRSITQPAAGITVSNSDGVSGNPTLALANDLAALEGLASTGVIVRTGDGTATTRTITGTTNRLDVNNGDGVSGNPTADISASYVGQASITTLGTVSTGTWNATTIGTSKGGTGLTATPSNGQLLIGNGSGYTLATLTDGSGITITEGAGTITIASTAAASGSASAINHLTNGDFSVFQRGTGDVTFTGNTTSGSAVVTSVSSVSGLSVGQGIYAASGITNGTTIVSIDSATQITLSANATATSTPATLYSATYNNAFCGADRWLVLRQDGKSVVGLGTNAAPGLSLVKWVTAGRMGICQWLESRTTRLLRGKTLAFQVDVASTGTDTMRVAILEWTGTADTLGSARDPVNDWTSGTFTAGNFFKGTTQNVIATGSASVSSKTTVSCSGAIGASANNVCVMVWMDDTSSANTPTFSDAELFEGSSSRTPQPVDPAINLTRCERFFYKTFALGTQPVANAGAAGSNRFYTSYTTGGYVTNFRQRMHRVPTLVVYNPGSASTGTFRNATDSTNLTAVPGTATDHGVVIGSAAATADKEYQFHLTADAEIA